MQDNKFDWEAVFWSTQGGESLYVKSIIDVDLQL
jgi:hypothetical protein